jgi:hypothetical protein
VDERKIRLDDPTIGTRGSLMTEYKEIIVALIAVFGAVLPFLFQKNKEWNLKLRSKNAKHTQRS